MKKIDYINSEDAVCKVKGYKHNALNVFGIIGIFIPAIIISIVISYKKMLTNGLFITACTICGALIALSVFTVVYYKITAAKIQNMDCVIFFENGIIVFINKPKTKKGYYYFEYNEIKDYGFINILQGDSGAGEDRLIIKDKSRTSFTYLKNRLLNFGDMRITTIEGGYYNIPVGDIEKVRLYFQKYTQIEEYIYIRIAGIHDNLE